MGIIYTGDGRWVHAAEWPDAVPRPWPEGEYACPAHLSYSTDIAAAWLVWEKLPWPKRLCDEDPDGLADREYRRYTVMCGGRSYGPDTDYRPEFTADADTAPEAICLAALRASGVEVPA